MNRIETYCNAALRAVLDAYQATREAKVKELPSLVDYGKADTLRMDAVAELVLKKALSRFDPTAVLLSEESGAEMRVEFPWQIFLQPLVFISDPLDGSTPLKKLLLLFQDRDCTFGEICSRSEIKQLWEEDIVAPPITISGCICAVSGIVAGVPLFSIILNLLTQDIFLCCELGSRRFNFQGISETEITLERVLEQGQALLFLDKAWQNPDDCKGFVSFSGKTGYRENLEGARIFFSGFDKYLVRGKIATGPARILYLSSLYNEEEGPVGFILGNGEPITEWVHWLPYLALAQERLRVFEIYFEKPWTKEGILMAPSPPYSIFTYDPEQNRYLLNFAKINDFPDPTCYRSTLLVTLAENHWVISRMEEQGYRELRFSFKRHEKPLPDGRAFTL